MDLCLSQVVDDFPGELRTAGIPTKVLGHMLVTCTTHESREGKVARQRRVKFTQVEEQKWFKLVQW